MTELDMEWLEYYCEKGLDQLFGEMVVIEPPKLKVGNTLQPTTAYMGCGIITEVWDVPEKRKGMYADHDYSYMVTILTDFGNEVWLSDVEVLENYKVTGIDADIKGRLELQIRNLTKVLEKLK